MPITVEALLEERRGYVVRDLPDRVAQVDAEILRLSGVVVDDVAEEPKNIDPNSAVELGSVGADIETAEAEPDVDIETPEIKRGPGRPRKD